MAFTEFVYVQRPLFASAVKCEMNDLQLGGVWHIGTAVLPLLLSVGRLSNMLYITIGVHVLKAHTPHFQEHTIEEGGGSLPSVSVLQ